MSEPEGVIDWMDDLYARRDAYPWWKRHLWWPWKRIWEDWSPRMICRRVKWFVQRGRRGWADRDTWGLDSYLAGWLPAALRHLKESKAGTPMSMFTDADMVEIEKGASWDGEAAAARWSATMDKMVAGFEAFTRMSDGVYEEELGPYPTGPGDKQQRNARFVEGEKLRERDEQIWREGSALFVEHFGSLWD